MTERQIAAREKELQSYLRVHPRLNLEFKAMMSRLLREHRIDVTPETLSRLTVSLDRSGADVAPDEGMVPLLAKEDKEPPAALASPEIKKQAPPFDPAEGEDDPGIEPIESETIESEETGERP